MQFQAAPSWEIWSIPRVSYWRHHLLVRESNTGTPELGQIRGRIGPDPQYQADLRECCSFPNSCPSWIVRLSGGGRTAISGIYQALAVSREPPHHTVM